MAKKVNGVSSKTHSQKQLDHYANQHNPNNKAFKANQANKAKQRHDKKQQERERSDDYNNYDLEFLPRSWWD